MWPQRVERLVTNPLLIPLMHMPMPEVAGQDSDRCKTETPCVIATTVVYIISFLYSQCRRVVSYQASHGVLVQGISKIVHVFISMCHEPTSRELDWDGITALLHLDQTKNNDCIQKHCNWVRKLEKSNTRSTILKWCNKRRDSVYRCTWIGFNHNS